MQPLHASPSFRLLPLHYTLPFQLHLYATQKTSYKHIRTRSSLTSNTLEVREYIVDWSGLLTTRQPRMLFPKGNISTLAICERSKPHTPHSPTIPENAAYQSRSLTRVLSLDVDWPRYCLLGKKALPFFHSVLVVGDSPDKAERKKP